MARWSESRGYTLILSHPQGPDRYARLALVRKRTLFGEAFNVQEARAEDASCSGHEPETLGMGRMLSWRWLGEREAQELLSARLRTLEALGYRVLGGGAETAARGPWDWLRELVDRQLARAGSGAKQGEAGEGNRREQGEDAGEDPSPAVSLRDALEHLGLEPDKLIAGIATALELETAELREPTLATLRKLEPEALVLLLPFWLEHESAKLRRIGHRWLELGPTLYEVDVEVVEGWAAGPGLLATAIGDRLEREGLALLGPEGLARLAHKAMEPRTRSLAASWQTRLRSPARAPG